MKIKMPEIEKIVNNLDVIAATIGIFLGIFIIYLYYLINLKQQDIGFVIFAACSLYLLLRNKFKRPDFSFLRISPREKLLLNIIFLSIFSVTLVIWYMQLYHRPFIYFILISILAAIIAFEILYFKEGNAAVPILLKIFLLSISIRAGIFYNFPSMMGYDAYWHAKIAELITINGFVPPIEINDKYHYYPIFHIFLSISQIFSQSNIKDAIFYSIGFTNILHTIFIYLIGKKIAGSQVGLLATLLINITNDIIVTGITNITPGSLVLDYFLLILYFIFKNEHKFITRFLGVFMTFLMIITHQLSTFVALVSMTSFYAGEHIYQTIYKSKEHTVNFTYILFFTATIIFYWMNSYYNPTLSFFEAVVGPFINVVQKGEGDYGSNVLIVGTEYQRTFLDISFLHLSYLILPFFAIGGTLLWLSLKKYNKLMIINTVVILYSFIYIVPLFGIRNLLTDRWFPFLIIFLVILSSAYIFKLIQIFTFNISKIFALFTIVIIFTFFMITTPSINKDNPLVTKDTTIRNQFNYNEISASKTVSNISAGKIKVDSSFYLGFFYYGTNSSSFFQTQSKSLLSIYNKEFINSSKFRDKNATIIVRKSTLKEPTEVSSPIYGISFAQSLPKEFFESFESNDFNLVYNNGNVLGYKS